MKKYFLIVSLLFSLSLHANIPNINECMNDIYFANSILTTEEEADLHVALIKRKLLIEEYDLNEIAIDRQLTFKKNYNETHGLNLDIYDSFMFLANEEAGWHTYKTIMELIVDLKVGKIVEISAKYLSLSKQEQELFDKLFETIDVTNNLDIFSDIREIDLTKQIKSYRESIRSGHGVIIVAHGKGDIFTAKAYEEMLKPEGDRNNAWMDEFVSWISVGSPTREARDLYFGFDNDSVAYWSTHDLINNPTRSYEYNTPNAVGEYVQKNEYDFHKFNYYMGEQVRFKDAYGERNISTDIVKTKIMTFLHTSIDKHKDRQSQWGVKQEFDKGTKDYKITVKHLHDSNNISMGDTKIYPFAASKKLYHVKDETPGGNGWVKASCGGSEVFDYWEDKGTVDDYKLLGTNEIIFHNILTNEIKVRSVTIGYSIDECEIDGCPLITDEMRSNGDFLVVWYSSSDGTARVVKSKYVPKDEPYPDDFSNGWLIGALGAAKAELYSGIDTNNVIKYIENIYKSIRYTANGEEEHISDIGLVLYYK